MPGFNSTGPFGAGPGTGRKRGRCFGFGNGSYQDRSWFGFGRRGGRGFCRWQPGWGRRGFFAGSDEKDLLLQEKTWLERRLDAIRERLSSFGS